MVDEPSYPQNKSPTRIIEDVFGGPDLEGFELAIASLEFDEQVGKIAGAGDELSTNIGVEVET